MLVGNDVKWVFKINELFIQVTVSTPKLNCGIGITFTSTVSLLIQRLFKLLVTTYLVLIEGLIIGDVQLVQFIDVIGLPPGRIDQVNCVPPITLSV